VTEYHAAVQVVVTFDSLCALTHSYARSRPVASGLCDKLRTAATATSTKKRNNALAAYRNQVDAQTGKAFTPAQAEILARLSLRLQGPPTEPRRRARTHRVRRAR
jgi:hypothetical protein